MSDEDQRVSVSILQYLGPANSGSCGYCKRGRRKTPGVTDNEEPSFSLGKLRFCKIRARLASKLKKA